MSAFTALLSRDLALVLRRPGDVTVVLAFFVVAVTLFPLGIGPETNLLQRVAAGILWCAALFAAMLSLERLFASDHEDGALDLLLMAPSPLELIALGKCAAHWIVTGVPLAILVNPTANSLLPEIARLRSHLRFREAFRLIDRTIALIKECGCKAGLVFNPATPLTYLDHVLDKLDLVLIMSVNPGFGGQQFIPEALAKLRAVRQRIDATGRDIWLEVDGGVKIDNIAEVARAGADTFVAGSAIFGAGDYKATITRMRGELAKV